MRTKEVGGKINSERSVAIFEFTFHFCSFLTFSLVVFSMWLQFHSVCCYTITLPLLLWSYVPQLVSSALWSPHTAFSVVSPCGYFRNCTIPYFPHILRNRISCWQKRGCFLVDRNQAILWDPTGIRRIRVQSCATKGLNVNLTIRCTKFKRRFFSEFLTPYTQQQTQNPSRLLSFWACNRWTSACRGQHTTEGFEIILQKKFSLSCEQAQGKPTPLPRGYNDKLPEAGTTHGFSWCSDNGCIKTVINKNSDSEHFLRIQSIP